MTRTAPTRTATPAATATATPMLPPWVGALINSYRSGESHAFIVHGDVDGTAYETVSQRRLIEMTALRQDLPAAERREVVLRYARSTGLTLYAPDEQITLESGAKVSRQTRALDLLGATAAVPANPMQAALGALGTPAPAAGNILATTKSVASALDLLTKLLLAPAGAGKVSVIIDYADSVVPPADKGTMSDDNRTTLVTLLTWAKDPRIAESGNIVILISRSITDLHPDLRAASSGYRAIELALPDHTARLRYVEGYLASRTKMGQPIGLADGLTVTEMATLTAGLSLRNIEDVLLVGAHAGGMTRLLLKQHKDAIIRSEQAEVAEMIEPLPGGFSSLFAASYLQDWARTEIIGPVRSGDLRRMPKGVLLVGPPGTGKTYAVRAIAAEIGFNAVALRAENILGGIVGESERKLAQFFRFVKALAPVLVFFDEIDQSDMAQRGNGSGNPVAGNLFNQMLQFLSDETLRGSVLFIFASNRPDLLDDAFKRSGRIDAIIPLLLPNAEERAILLSGLARTQGCPMDDATAAGVAARTDRYSPADLAAVVTKARKLAQRNGDGIIMPAIADLAVRYTRPSGIDKADLYTRLAVAACNDLEHLPLAYQELALRAADESTEAALALPARTGRQARQ